MCPAEKKIEAIKATKILVPVTSSRMTLKRRQANISQHEQI